MFEISHTPMPTTTTTNQSHNRAKRKMGRQSESLLLYRPKMSLAEALMWLVFDICLTVLKFLAPLGLLILLAQNIWRYTQGRSFFQHHFKNEALHILEVSVEIWFMIEIAFYVYIKIKARKMRKRGERNVFPATNKEQRAILFERVLKTVDSVEAMVEQWFVDPDVNFNDLSRDDVAEIMSYSMFHKKRRDMNPDERQELEGFLVRMESILGRKIPSRAHPVEEDKYFENLITRSAMFFTETELTFQHRPLIMYFVIQFLFQGVFAPLRMILVGRYKRCTANKDLVYWIRRSKTHQPNRQALVFLHGIGVGLLPYAIFFDRLERLADKMGYDLIVVEIPVISQTLSPGPLLPDPFVANIKRALRDSGFLSAKFITHSYGSFCVNWIVTRAPELVDGLMLIDPAAILLHQTDILYNMLYRTCGKTNLDRVLHYVMRSEIHFVYHLKREFFWFHNAMFFESFPERIKVSIVVSEADQVIPVQRIVQYAKDSSVDHIMLKGCDHGGFLVGEKHLGPVMSRIKLWLESFPSTNASFAAT